MARIDRHCEIPVREQFISIGAAVQNILLVAHDLGYGARIVSGAKTRDQGLCSALGLVGEEELIGFICIGTMTRATKVPDRPDPADFLVDWSGALTR